MKALTAIPGTADSLEILDITEPSASERELLVDGLYVGVCGTDHEISSGAYGWAPEGHKRLVIGHESLGRVRQAPPDSTFHAGDLVVGVVRRPDPEPCGACARGQFDMCRNGRYTERGIKSRDGYASERWAVEEDYAVRLDHRLADVGMLMEPTTVVTKAWAEVDAVGSRSWFSPHRVLVTGAGPIGLLAAMIGAQRGLDVHVLDRETDGPKPGLVRRLRATYHTDPIDDVMATLRPDVVIEATGASQLVFPVIAAMPPYGIVCLTGVSSGGHQIPVDAGQVNRQLVLDNAVVVGSVNANLKHYAQAAQILAQADVDWLSQLVTRKVPLARFQEAFTRQPGDVKVAIDVSSS